MIPGRNQKGFILFMTPIVIISIVVFGYMMVARSRTAMKIAGNELDYLHIGFCTQQCVALGLNQSVLSLENGTVLSGVDEACPCSSEALPRGLDCRFSRTPSVDEWKTNCHGMNFLRTLVTVTSQCTDQRNRNGQLEEYVGLDEFPIFQFAGFFDDILELDPQPNMHILGRLHSNGTIALHPAKDLFFHDWITAVEGITLRQSNYGPGKGYFPLADGGYDKSPIDMMAKENTSLAAVAPDWEKWKNLHRVAFKQDGNSCQQVPRLSLPFKESADNHAIIEWRKTGDSYAMKRQKFAWKSSLIYKDGWRDGSLDPLTAPPAIHSPPAGFTKAGMVTAQTPARASFWETRDEVMVNLIPVDVSVLQAWRPADSIIYLYDSLVDPVHAGKVSGGFLLHNAGKLIRPLTIVTNTRMVLLGDYNTEPGYTPPGSAAKTVFPAALVSDGFTQLSADFLPEEHAEGMSLGSMVLDRNPKAAMTLNACIMTGMVSVNGRFEGQGGFNNFIRLLEKLKNVPHNITGSQVCIWSSRHCVGKFGNGDAYWPPVRNFSFDPIYNDMRNMPPGTPRLVSPVLIDWEVARK
jgi:hypothetical protein